MSSILHIERTTTIRAGRYHLSARILLAVSLLAASLALFAAERTFRGDWPLWAHILGATTLLFYVRHFYIDKKEVLLTGFYQFYYFIGLLTSAALVSSGIYVFEVAKFGTANGIFWVVIFYFVVGLEISALGYRAGQLVHIGDSQPRRLSWRFTKTVVYAFAGCTLLLSALVFLIYGGPHIQGVDRVTFWRHFVPGSLSFIPTLALQSFFFVALYYLWKRKAGQSTAVATLILAGYVFVTIFVLGEKFSAFIFFAVAWLALVAALFPIFRLRKSHLLLILGLMLALAASVVISYMLAGRKAAFAIARIALQAQLLWSVFAESGDLKLFSAHWGCYFGCGQFTDGMDFISYRYLPHHTYSFYRDGGTKLSGFQPALSILSFGIIPSILMHICATFLLGILQSKFVAAIRRNNMIYGFLIFKLMSGATLFWFATMQSATLGMVVTLLIIGLYYALFAQRQPSRHQAIASA